jgi:FHS family Na+ dependent glucose MFS transporter 1
MSKNEKTRNTIGYYLLFICLGLGLGITGPALPSLAEQTGSTIGGIGTMFLAGSIGYTLGTVVGGWIFDRIRRGHLALGIAQLVSAGLLGAIPFADSLPVLLVIVFTSGLSNGILNTGTNTLLMWTHGEKAGPFINGLHFAFGLGAFLAPTLYAQLLTRGASYREAYWVMAGIAIPVALFLLVLPGSPQHVHKQDEKTKGHENLLKYLPVIATGMLFLFFYVGSEVTFGNWIYTYTLTLNLASATQAAYLTSGFWLAFTIGRLISIPVAARFKPEQILAIALVGCLVILSLAMAAPNSLTLLWTSTLGLGFFMAPVWPTGYNLAGQSVKLTATVSSVILLGDSLGGMVLPWLTGQVLERYGAQSMTWLVFGSLVLNLLVFFALIQLRQRSAQPLPEQA